MTKAGGLKDLTTQFFSVSVRDTSEKTGIKTYRIKARDRYYGWRHVPVRRIVRLFTSTLDFYLRKQPNLAFDSRRNIARHLVYLPPAFRAWTAYMPGGFATHYVHNPDHKRLYSGKRIGLITRNLFRHSVDAVGLRSRAYAMAWYAHDVTKGKHDMTWLSLASGTGQPTFDAGRIIAAEKKYYLCDADGLALRFAKQLSKTYDIPETNLYTSHLDITREGVLDRLMEEARPDVVDAMGFFEYLDDEHAVKILSVMQKTLKQGGVFIFTNMLNTRKQLDIHKRGMGWPGVIPRSIDKVAELMERAGIPKKNQRLILPDDGVYGVYIVDKRRQAA